MPNLNLGSRNVAKGLLPNLNLCSSNSTFVDFSSGVVLIVGWIIMMKIILQNIQG